MENHPLVLLYRQPELNLPIKDRLSSHFPLLDSTDSQGSISSFLSTYAHSVRVLIGVGWLPITSEMLSLLPSLELIVVTSAGVNHIDLQHCRRRGISITNASLAFAEDVADLAVALLIDVLRRISSADRFVRAGSWLVDGDYPLGFKLGGKRVGIVGLGSIGSEIAKRLISFGCKIAYNSRTKKPSAPYQYYANVNDLAADSNILIVACSLTEQTHHIINQSVLTALGQEGVIINVGRGGHINEKVLVEYLMQRKIGGAGLDVFENEPHVPKELFSLDNVVFSPHCGALTPESLDAVMELTVANVKAFFSNEPLKSVVQLE